MREGMVTALLWLGFGGTHVGLAIAPVRKRLVAWLGETGYLVLYSVIAVGTFAALVRYVALHQFDAPHGTLVATIPPVHGALLDEDRVGRVPERSSGPDGPMSFSAPRIRSTAKRSDLGKSGAKIANSTTSAGRSPV